MEDGQSNAEAGNEPDTAGALLYGLTWVLALTAVVGLVMTVCSPELAAVVGSLRTER